MERKELPINLTNLLSKVLTFVELTENNSIYKEEKEKGGLNEIK